MDLIKLLTRYWFEFYKDKVTDLPAGLGLGCGVTAFNYLDAISILEDKVFRGQVLPQIKVQKENVDIRTLDAGHVIPNMQDPTLRGVWFPMGYL